MSDQAGNQNVGYLMTQEIIKMLIRLHRLSCIRYSFMAETIYLMMRLIHFGAIKVNICTCITFLTHLSRRLMGELIGYPCSGVRLSSSTISNIFSETACHIKAKFYVEPPWVGGTKSCSRHLGHMTKTAATPIYGKNPSKSSSPEPGADFHKTWYVASGTPANHSLFK